MWNSQKKILMNKWFLTILDEYNRMEMENILTLSFVPTPQLVLLNQWEPLSSFKPKSDSRPTLSETVSSYLLNKSDILV